MFENSRILITGGTGSWGTELTTQLLERSPREIIIFSRGELAQVTMERKFNDPRLKFIIGDIRDYSAVLRATKEIHYIFHLAALKHVPVCEYQPQEAIKTNIVGTTNLINAAIENKVIKVIDVSTDKAVDPLNLYGMTKAVGERLTIQANLLSDCTSFVCIRGGNVLGSNGSVIPYFIDQIKKENKVKITDKKMTRYFMTLPEAIQLLFKVAEHSIGGETFVMNMPSFKILDAAKVLIDIYGNDKTEIEEIGIRPGEKLDEVLVSKHEAVNTYEFNKEYYLILPTIIPKLYESYKQKKLNKVAFSEFTSKTKLSSIPRLKKLLKQGGFI